MAIRDARTGYNDQWRMPGTPYGDVGSMDAAAKPPGMGSRRPQMGIPGSRHGFLAFKSTNTWVRIAGSRP